MEKRKLLAVVLFCLGFAGMTLAEHVINIDFNGDVNDPPYAGEAAIAGEDVWLAVSDGTGKAVGSDRTANLANYDEPNMPSIYAAQVWITIPEDGLFNRVEGDELLDDGFQTAGGTDPCIYILAEPQDTTLPSGAYKGTFDLYVYSDSAGSITVVNVGQPGGSDTKYMSGGTGFNPGQTYVVFENVIIDDGNDIIPDDGNDAVVIFTNKISGMQLVKDTPVIEVTGGLQEFLATDYSVAKETNARGGEQQPFGPDMTDEANAVYYLDQGEYMIYDLHVADSNAGEYSIRARVHADGNNDTGLLIFYEDIKVSTLYRDTPGGGDPNPVWMSGTENNPFNLFKGDRELKWEISANYLYFNLLRFELDNEGPLNMSDCSAVYKYKYNYTADYNKDCDVDTYDLATFVESWITCYSPDPADCP